MSGKPNSLLRNIGQFVGHIAHAVKTDPAAPPAPPATSEPAASAVTRTTVEEHSTPDGTLILRRTTIDEIVPVDTTIEAHEGSQG